MVVQTGAVATGARRAPGRAAPPGVLVVVGGLPGSGKTTLLRRLLAERPRGVVGLDSEDVAARAQLFVDAAVAQGLPFEAAVHVADVALLAACGFRKGEDDASRFYRIEGDEGRVLVVAPGGRR